MKKVLVFIFTLLGMIIGVSIGESGMLGGPLAFLAIGGELGFKSPIVVDLNFMQFTIGFWCKVNIIGLVLMVVFCIISKKLLDFIKI